MKNLWPDSFQSIEDDSIKSLLEEQIKLLPKLTNGLVYGKIDAIESLDPKGFALSYDFKFNFQLFGSKLEGYSFNVFSYGHDITFYPVKFILDQSLYEEIFPAKKNYQFAFTANNPKELERFISMTLQSARLRRVIGAMMKLSS